MMKAIRSGVAVLCCMILLSLSQVAAARQKAISRDAEVEGTKIHYLISSESPTGPGPAVILLHGYAETSRMWAPLFPLLADKFTRKL